MTPGLRTRDLAKTLFLIGLTAFALSAQEAGKSAKEIPCEIDSASFTNAAWEEGAEAA